MAVLMGANSRTYKFALGAALLELAAAGHETVSMSELAAPYALRLAERAAHFPQAPPGSVGGGTDFLAVLQSEGPATRAAGQPSERLVAAAADSMPGMVMQKFHNLRAVGPVDHTFYEIRGKGASRRVVLRDELRRVARHSSQRRALGPMVDR